MDISANSGFSFAVADKVRKSAHDAFSQECQNKCFADDVYFQPNSDKHEGRIMIMGEVDDAMVEAWFLTHDASAHDLSEQALWRIAAWFPVIGVAANDRSIRAGDADRPMSEAHASRPRFGRDWGVHQGGAGWVKL